MDVIGNLAKVGKMFPQIDYLKCTNCLNCLSCPVYALIGGKVQVHLPQLCPTICKNIEECLKWCQDDAIRLIIPGKTLQQLKKEAKEIEKKVEIDKKIFRDYFKKKNIV